MEFISITLSILGALGLFLFGMKIMSDGIQKASGETLQNILNHITSNRFVGVLSGFIITAIIQSSSATTVMVVSFVNAGLLSLTQSIGVIFGANIGTTITGWIVSILGFKLSLSKLAVPLIGLSLPLFFSKNEERRNWGEFMIGFGILFLGLSLMKKAVPEVNAEDIHFLTRFTNMGFFSTIIFLLAGALLTVVVHSSSASMAITLTLAYKGVVPYEAAAAMILGSNIGTTIDAFLASIGANVNARRAAMVHIAFNIAGSLIALILFRPLLSLVEVVVPGTDITTHLAAFHTIFNIINTVLFIGFVPQIASLIEKIVTPRETETVSGKYKLEFIQAYIQETPEINLLKAKKEISTMTGITEEMYNSFLKTLCGKPENLSKIIDDAEFKEDYIDQMQEEISTYLDHCLTENMTEKSKISTTHMQRIVNEIESIADNCFHLVLLNQKRINKKITLHKNACDEIREFATQVQDFLIFVKNNIESSLDQELLRQAYQLEKEINNKRSELRKNARKKLQKGADVKGELLYLDIVRRIEHIGDYCLNISESLKNIR